MSPGERLEITAQFEKPLGIEHFPIRLTFKDALDAEEFRRNLSHGMFFGALLTFCVMFLLSPDFLMNAASKWFAVYLAFIALLAMHSHGYGLSVLGLSSQMYFPMIRVLHSGVVLCYVFFVLSFLNASRSYPMFWRCAVAYIFVSLPIAFLEHTLASAQFQMIANLVPVTFLLLGSVGAYLAVRDRLDGARFFATGFLVLVITGVVNYLASLPPLAVWNDTIDQLTMVMQTGDAVIFGGALLSQMYGMRRARDEAVDAQMSEMRRRLDLNSKLLSTEGDLRRARDLAERHRANLAETSHDLRQPISSLRIALEAAQSRAPETVSDLSAGIDFLDNLLEQTLAQTRPVPGAASAEGQSEHESAVDVEVIFLNAQRMFAQEAAQKGIELTIVPCALAVRVPTIDLIRIVSNLVSNAVRYAQDGRVLIGVRRRNGHAAIEVWDTGPGLSEEAQVQVMQRYVRAAAPGAPSGEGLGLAIVRQLADKNGLSLSVRSTPGKGSVFAVDGLVIVENALQPLTNK